MRPHVLFLAMLLSSLLSASSLAKQSPMDSTLERAQAQSRTYSAVHLILDNVHPLWGGVRFEVSSSGLLTRIDVPRQGQEPVVNRVQLDDRQADTLVQTLQDVQAWKQRVAERTPVHDESRATLTFLVGRLDAEVWEWSNDLVQNDRLIRVQHALNRMLPAGAP